MRNSAEIPRYSPAEERLNITSHAIGLVLSIGAGVALIRRTIPVDDARIAISFGIFGLSLIILYATSTAYHSSKNPARRGRFRILDHASIYILIAGTYTPFTLITLHGPTGWMIFGTSWSMAFTGIILKFSFAGKYKLLSTLMYVFMGWLIVFALGPLIDKLPGAGLAWLVAGGVAYTLGAVLYSIKKIRFNHAIFHVFVLLGSGCHFMSVYFYVV